MPRYVIHLAYDGTRYNGWQRQPDAETVQGVLEEALGTVLREDVRLHGSGRTDTGVHAENQYAHFDAHQPVDRVELQYRLGRLLPDDILVRNIGEVDGDFHARFDAEWRQYRYQLLTEPDPFLQRYAWYPGGEPDCELMRECLAMLEGEQDFSGFSKNDGSDGHSRCTIMTADLERSSRSMLMLRFRANRFRRSMVRALTGGLVAVALGKSDTDWFSGHLKEGQEIGKTALAPAKGLFLEKVFYPKAVLDLT